MRKSPTLVQSPPIEEALWWSQILGGHFPKWNKHLQFSPPQGLFNIKIVLDVVKIAPKQAYMFPTSKWPHISNPHKVIWPGHDSQLAHLDYLKNPQETQISPRQTPLGEFSMQGLKETLRISSGEVVHFCIYIDTSYTKTLRKHTIQIWEPISNVQNQRNPQETLKEGGEMFIIEQIYETKA